MKWQQSRSFWYGAVAAGACVGGVALVRYRRHFDLRGKVVLITGGSRGLGLAMARRFAGEGARLALCARDEQELKRAGDDLRTRGAEVLNVPCDVTIQSEAERLVRSVAQHFGRIDVLVNNAGLIEVGPMETMTVHDYQQLMNVHFWGPLYLTQAVLPVLRANHGGRICNIASIGGKISMPHLLSYNASKFALTGFSEGLRAELMKDNILVTTVCPPPMRTGSPRQAFFKGRHRDEYAWFAIADALPLFSLSAERAARRIVAAVKYGKAEVMLGTQARVAVTVHGLFPGLFSDVLGLVNRFLPAPGGIGPEVARGAESESPLTQSPWTSLSQSAAKDYNEM